MKHPKSKHIMYIENLEDVIDYAGLIYVMLLVIGLGIGFCLGHFFWPK